MAQHIGIVAVSAEGSALARALEAARAWDNRVHMANVPVNQAQEAGVRDECA